MRLRQWEGTPCVCSILLFNPSLQYRVIQRRQPIKKKTNKWSNGNHVKAPSLFLFHLPFPQVGYYLDFYRWGDWNRGVKWLAQGCRADLQRTVFVLRPPDSFSVGTNPNFNFDSVAWLEQYGDPRVRNRSFFFFHWNLVWNKKAYIKNIKYFLLSTVAILLMLFKPLRTWIIFNSFN